MEAAIFSEMSFIIYHSSRLMLGHYSLHQQVALTSKQKVAVGVLQAKH